MNLEAMDELDYFELRSLIEVFDPKLVDTLRDGEKLDSRQQFAVDTVDGMIERETGSRTALQFYIDLGTFKAPNINFHKELAYMAGTLQKPKGNYISVKAPAGTKALQLSEDIILLKRGIGLNLRRESDFTVAATFHSTASPTVSGLLNPIDPLKAFHMSGQHDQSSHGKGRGGGYGAANIKLSKTAKIVIAVAAIAVAIVSIAFVAREYDSAANQDGLTPRQRRQAAEKKAAEEEEAKMKKFWSEHEASKQKLEAQKILKKTPLDDISDNVKREIYQERGGSGGGRGRGGGGFKGDQGGGQGGKGGGFKRRDWDQEEKDIIYDKITKEGWSPE